MTTKKTTTGSRRKKPSTSKGAAARSKKEKTVTFRGLKLKLPAKLPGTILFDLADLESGNDLRGTMEFLKSLVGDEQYQAIRSKIAEDGVGLDEVDKVLIELLESILEASGLSQGE